MKLHKQQGQVALGLLGLIASAALIVFVVWGYVTNAIAAVHNIGTLDMLELLRLIGLFVFPLGWFLGWFA